MKILDLLEGLVDTEIERPKQYSKQLRRTDKKMDSGFSTVRTVRNDPHMIQKYSHTPLS